MHLEVDKETHKGVIMIFWQNEKLIAREQVSALDKYAVAWRFVNRVRHLSKNRYHFLVDGPDHLMIKYYKNEGRLIVSSDIDMRTQHTEVIISKDINNIMLHGLVVKFSSGDLIHVAYRFMQFLPVVDKAPLFTSKRTIKNILENASMTLNQNVANIILAYLLKQNE